MVNMMTTDEQNESERRQTKIALEDSQRLLSMLVNHLPGMVCRSSNDSQHSMQYTNIGCETLTGYSVENFLGHQVHFGDLIVDKDKQRVWDEIQTALKEKTHFNISYRINTSNNVQKWVTHQGFGVYAEDGSLRHFESYIMDVTATKKIENSLISNLQEKDTFLMELHHRIKNNMQVITSILSIQSRYITVEGAHRAFADCKQRVRAMALIHDQLCTSNDLGHIDINKYLNHLCERLIRVHNNIHRFININIDDTPLLLSVDSALPCVMIINELVTNSIKYAYRENENVVIDIHFCTDIEDSRCQVSVRDYGCGFDGNQYLKSPETVGFVIIQALVKQILGELQYKEDNGSEFILRFTSN